MGSTPFALSTRLVSVMSSRRHLRPFVLFLYYYEGIGAAVLPATADEFNLPPLLHKAGPFPTCMLYGSLHCIHKRVHGYCWTASIQLSHSHTHPNTHTHTYRSHYSYCIRACVSPLPARALYYSNIDTKLRRSSLLDVKFIAYTILYIVYEYRSKSSGLLCHH